jgi:hypothetical protein
MYGTPRLSKVFDYSRRALLEINRIYHRKVQNKLGVKVMKKDWDNLVILDACRYDLFEEINSIEGELGSVISGDSSTSGFLKYNFADDRFPTAVYIAANPQVQRHRVGRQFHDCIRLWETDWDDKSNTVLPEKVTDAAIRAQGEYPNKRLIVHYIQPHYPFIGKTGRKIDHGSITGDGVIKDTQEYSSIWDQLESGAIEEDLVRSAYRENLELVIPEVKRLLGELIGKSVVTSDHGNVFGKLGVYGHPGGKYMPGLVNVPWLVVDGTNRRRIERGKINNTQEVDNRVEDRLRDLGYAE